MVENKQIPKVTAIKLLFTLAVYFEDKHSNFSVNLDNEDEGDHGLVNVRIAQDAVLDKWSEWSSCSISCLPSSGIHGERKSK